MYTGIESPIFRIIQHYDLLDGSIEKVHFNYEPCIELSLSDKKFIFELN